MRHHKRRKLFFPFGLITLALLPVIGFQKIATLYKEKTAPIHCIELNYSPSQKSPLDTIFTIEKTIKQRAYKSFILTNNIFENEIKLTQARLLYNKIKQNKDTVNGVHIAFNDSTKYQDFITAIDYCFENWPPAFAINGNDIWAMYINVDKPKYKKEEVLPEGAIY